MSRIESFTRMFSPEAAHGEVVARVEIPLIQRDFAQGRRGEKVDAIRRNFLAVLRDAVAGDASQSVSLDFVYGELKEDGTLQPLDGQQRLTTLFLLHWYISARSGNLTDGDAWTKFTYETRPSARRFCQRLVGCVPPAHVSSPSEWVRDQPWYLYVWRYDPTINSMLVMLDAIDDEFHEVDAHLAWERLTDAEQPAISFHLLPLPDMGSAEDLYVKMNSRGKPLTEFENFKARFEKVIEWSPAAAEEFATKADTDWADVLWAVRGDNDLVDDEFLRYFDFVTEVCEWSDGELAASTGALTRLERATRVFGKACARREDHLAFLLTAFNVWKGRDIAATFDELFRPSSVDGDGRIPLFFRDSNVNLFEAACRNYGEVRGGGNRSFTFGQTLLLYAVVLHLEAEVDDFPARLRTLRNLIEGSQYEMRGERMPRLVADTKALIKDGALPEPKNTFAVAQIHDEAEKREFLASYPELVDTVRALEDHELLRGSTAAFQLDPDQLTRRWKTFDKVMSSPDLWWDLTGAMLTVGEYQWPRQRNGTLTDSDAFQFGTWHQTYRDSWREVLVGRSRSESGNTSSVLGRFLDAVAESSTAIESTLNRMQEDWLSQCDEDGAYDWRYYMVKYRPMRAGASGLYYAHGRRMGFSLTNLPGGRKYRNAYFHDPYLHTVYQELGEPDFLQRPSFSGYEWHARWMRLAASGVGIRCVPGGYELLPPTAAEHADAFKSAMSSLGAIEADDRGESKFLIVVPKSTDDAAGPDSEDRIQLGVSFVRALVEAGL